MADDLQLAEATQPLSFAEFLERMKDPAAADLVRFIKLFIKEFDGKAPDPDRDSAKVQDFLRDSEAKFRGHPVWASAPGEHQQQAIEGLEKYLMTKLYGKVFAVSENDRERDESLARRMEALSFVKAEHLDIPAGHRDHTAWLLAMKELHKINNYKAPRDKLVCILNCCRVINNLLHVGVQGNEAHGADDFLPVLIYVVIHANPPQLASNLMYIERFRMHSRMMSESAYFFTQLYSAMSFIETINSGSLTMDPDEFVAHMVAAGITEMPAPAPDAGSGAKPSAGDAAVKPSSPPFAASFAEHGVAPSQPAPIKLAPSSAADFLRSELQSPTRRSAAAEQAAGTGEQPPAQLPVVSQAAAVGLSPMPAPQRTPQPPQLNPTLVAPPQQQQAGQPGAAAHLPVQNPSTAVPPAAPLVTAHQPLHPQAAAATLPYDGRMGNVAELEAEGGPLLLSAAQSGSLLARHPFLHAAPGDLRVGDVTSLLTAYKEVVLRYESLAAAVAARAAAAAAAAAPQLLAPAQQASQHGAAAAGHPEAAPQPGAAGVAQQAAASASIDVSPSSAAEAQPPTAQPPEAPVTSMVPTPMPATLQRGPQSGAEATPAAHTAPLPAVPELAVDSGSATPQQATHVTVANPLAAAAAAASQPWLGAASAGYPVIATDGPHTRGDPHPDAAPAAPAASESPTVQPAAASEAGSEQQQFIAAAADTAAVVPDTGSPRLSADQLGALAEPSDSVRSLAGSTAAATVSGDEQAGSREDDDPRDHQLNPDGETPAVPEEDEEAELAALEAELAAERAATSAGLDTSADTSAGHGTPEEQPPLATETWPTESATEGPDPVAPELGSAAADAAVAAQDSAAAAGSITGDGPGGVSAEEPAHRVSAADQNPAADASSPPLPSAEAAPAEAPPDDAASPASSTAEEAGKPPSSNAADAAAPDAANADASADPHTAAAAGKSCAQGKPVSGKDGTMFEGMDVASGSAENSSLAAGESRGSATDAAHREAAPHTGAVADAEAPANSGKADVTTEDPGQQQEPPLFASLQSDDVHDASPTSEPLSQSDSLI